MEIKLFDDILDIKSYIEWLEEYNLRLKEIINEKDWLLRWSIKQFQEEEDKYIDKIKILNKRIENMHRNIEYYDESDED